MEAEATQARLAQRCVSRISVPVQMAGDAKFGVAHLQIMIVAWVVHPPVAHADPSNSEEALTILS